MFRVFYQEKKNSQGDFFFFANTQGDLLDTVSLNIDIFEII